MPELDIALPRTLGGDLSARLHPPAALPPAGHVYCDRGTSRLREMCTRRQFHSRFIANTVGIACKVTVAVVCEYRSGPRQHMVGVVVGDGQVVDRGFLSPTLDGGDLHTGHGAGLEPLAARHQFLPL